MNYMNTNWNNTAFAGNSIPTVGKHIPQSLEAHPYNSAFVSESNTEYNNHYETTPPGTCCYCVLLDKAGGFV